MHTLPSQSASGSMPNVKFVLGGDLADGNFPAGILEGLIRIKSKITSRSSVAWADEAQTWTGAAAALRPGPAAPWQSPLPPLEPLPLPSSGAALPGRGARASPSGEGARPRYPRPRPRARAPARPRIGPAHAAGRGGGATLTCSLGSQRAPRRANWPRRGTRATALSCARRWSRHAL